MVEGEPKFEEEKTEEPKRKSAISKVVGSTPKQEEEVLGLAEERFKKIDYFVYIPDLEKTPEQIEIINGILDKLPDFLKKYGATTLDITPNQIRFIENNKTSEEFIKKFNISDDYAGVYYPKKQLLIVIDQKDNLINAEVVLHELIHASSFNSLEVDSLELSKLKEALGTSMEELGLDIGLDMPPIHDCIMRVRRTGFSVHSKKNNEVYFDQINEAVTEELVKRFDQEYFGSINGISGRVKERQDYIANILKEHPDSKDLENNEGLLLSDIAIVNPQSGEYRPYTYIKERGILKTLIRDIFESRHNQGRFESEEQVFNVFAKAAMTGKLLEISRLIEKTYHEGSFKKTKEVHGKGTFRKLGELTRHVPKND